MQLVLTRELACAESWVGEQCFPDFWISGTEKLITFQFLPEMGERRLVMRLLLFFSSEDIENKEPDSFIVIISCKKVFF